MITTNDKRGYFVCDPDHDGLGFPVVARNVDEAKEAVHEVGWLEEYPKEDMDCLCLPDANIKGLPVGDDQGRLRCALQGAVRLLTRS